MRRAGSVLPILLLLAMIGPRDPARGAAPLDRPSLTRGQETFQRWCGACHGAGPDKPGTMALRAKYQDSRPAELLLRTDLSVPMIKLFVRRGVSVMPPFRKTEISDGELADLADYLSNPKAR